MLIEVGRHLKAWRELDARQAALEDERVQLADLKAVVVKSMMDQMPIHGVAAMLGLSVTRTRQYEKRYWTNIATTEEFTAMLEKRNAK